LGADLGANFGVINQTGSNARLTEFTGVVGFRLTLPPEIVPASAPRRRTLPVRRRDGR
jgi:hypothetical protein